MNGDIFTVHILSAYAHLNAEFRFSFPFAILWITTMIFETFTIKHMSTFRCMQLE